MRNTRGHVLYDFAILAFILIGSLLWIQSGIVKHSLLSVLVGVWGLAAVLAVPGAFALSRWRPSLGESVGGLVSEVVMLTAVAYVALPLLALMYSAFVRPFVELGFSDGLKIALFFVLLAALLAAFIWALKFPLFGRVAVSALVFGVLFGFAAFLTPLFIPIANVSEGKLYSILGGEAALALAAAAVQFYLGNRGSRRT